MAMIKEEQRDWSWEKTLESNKVPSACLGVAIGFRQIGGQITDTLSLVVMVTHKLPQGTLDPEEQIPLTIDGIPVDVQEVGEIAAY